MPATTFLLIATTVSISACDRGDPEAVDLWTGRWRYDHGSASVPCSTNPGRPSPVVITEGDTPGTLEIAASYFYKAGPCRLTWLAETDTATLDGPQRCGTGGSANELTLVESGVLTRVRPGLITWRTEGTSQPAFPVPGFPMCQRSEDFVLIRDTSVE